MGRIILRAMTKQKSNDNIALNRRALHDFSIEERFEAGISLEGCEVKSLRAGKVQLDQAYVILKNNEVWLLGASITPLQTASTHIDPEPQRTRKLLMHRIEIARLIGSVERKGYTLIPLSLYWKDNRVKLQVGLAKGKKAHDKRATEKERDWQREKQRILKPR
jgi:SsrA-binding protein